MLTGERRPEKNQRYSSSKLTQIGYLPLSSSNLSNVLLSSSVPHGGDEKTSTRKINDLREDRGRERLVKMVLRSKVVHWGHWTRGHCDGGVELEDKIFTVYTETLRSYWEKLVGGNETGHRLRDIIYGRQNFYIL